MAKYNITYKCGHEDRVELFGKMSVREWRLEQMAGELCPECQRKAEMERLKKQEEEDGLPSLTGSEKQIAWAMKLRDDALKHLRITSYNADVKIQQLQKQNDDVSGLQLIKEYVNTTMMYMSEQTDSKFFIDRRDELKAIRVTYFDVLSESGINKYLQKYEKYKQEYDDAHDVYAIAAKQEQEELERNKAEAEKSAQVTIQPEQKGSNTIVTLKVQDDTVKLCSDYDSNLVDVIHKLELKMTWNRPCWEFKAELFRGTAESALIEIGNKLLEKGYTVVFPSRKMADMALTGSFEKYKMNAVYAHKTEKNTLVVEYDKSDNGIPVLLGFIRGSKFKRNSNMCYVPVSAYESLEELSEANNFAWSKAASERMETYKQSLIIANPVHVDSDSAVKPTRKEFDLSDLNDD